MSAWPTPLPFGPWLLEERLAVSAMSEVWLGRRVEDATPRVIKRMLPIYRRDAMIRRLFRGEIRAMQRLADARLPRLLDHGEARGVLWLAMPHYPGASLRALLAQGPLKAAAACWLGAELADAVASLHGAGLVHADVSPENVQVGLDGRVLLLDLGIAVALGHSAPAHRGRVQYASPEQIAGLPLTEQTDLLALRKVLTELRVESASAGLDALSLASALRARVPDPHRACAELAARVASVQPRRDRPVWQAAELRGEAVTDPGVDDGATTLAK